MDTEEIYGRLNFLERELVEEILKVSINKVIQSDVEIIRDGQYIKQLPIIISGTVNVFNQVDTRKLLLYHIRPSQSCIMSFSAAIYNTPSMISAITIEPCQILLAPVDQINRWMTRYPRFNRLFFDLYHIRYLELLETINNLIFMNLDQRIIKYLNEKSKISGSKILYLRHHEIARDLGTAREVITRILKKLEIEQKIEQTEKGIKILNSGD